MKYLKIVLSSLLIFGLANTAIMANDLMPAKFTFKRVKEAKINPKTMAQLKKNDRSLAAQLSYSQGQLKSNGKFIIYQAGELILVVSAKSRLKAQFSVSGIKVLDSIVSHNDDDDPGDVVIVVVCDCEEGGAGSCYVEDPDPDNFSCAGDCDCVGGFDVYYPDDAVEYESIF